VEKDVIFANKTDNSNMSC